MALGLKFGKGKYDDDDKKLQTSNNTVILFEEFAKLNGSTSCRNLLENLDMRDEAEYKVIVAKNLFHTNCRKYVADAVMIAEKIINNSKCYGRY